MTDADRNLSFRSYTNIHKRGEKYVEECEKALKSDLASVQKIRELGFCESRQSRWYKKLLAQSQHALDKELDLMRFIEK